MNVNFGFLCDNLVNVNNKITAEGIGFDTIMASSTPARHAQFFAVISMQFSTDELDPKHIGLRIVDADGAEITTLDRQFDLIPPGPGYTYRTHRVEVKIENTIFPSFGDYAVIWLLEGSEIHRSTLKVM